MLISHYRFMWIALYISANLIAALIFGHTGRLDGDLVGYELPSISILIVSTAAVVASYFIWMGPVFCAINALPVSSIFLKLKYEKIPKDAYFVGILILLVQVLFLIYNVTYHVNVAGSRLVSTSSFRYLWMVLVPDALFLVYYGLYRKTQLFGLNLFVYVVSNVIRGWLGIWLIILFVEGAFRLLEKRSLLKSGVLVLFLFLPILPILVELKLIIRGFGEGGHYSEVFSILIATAFKMNWVEAVTAVINPLVMRFQHLANVIGIVDISSVLASDLDRGAFKHFYSEGAPQYVITTLLGLPQLSDIHVQLLTYLIPTQLPVNTITNTHVGLVGWFWIDPHSIPFYLLYLIGLSWLGLWLAKKAGGNDLLINVVWFAWLGYLMNGWFAAYIEFVQAIFVVICIRLIAASIGLSEHRPPSGFESSEFTDNCQRT